jgi:Protein of unknown function (DUF2442)
VWFEDGQHGFFSLKTHLETGLFTTLKDRRLFDAVRVEYGTLVWHGELDIAPDTVESELKIVRRKTPRTMAPI